MRVPIRKPGQYTHYKPDPHVTAEKLQEFKDELEKLKHGVQPRAISEVKRLAELGDFSENAAYQIAKGKLRGLNERIQELEDAIKKAIVITHNSHAGSIQIGSRVTIEMDGKQKIYQLLGSAESDPDQGIISHTSPLGSALIGKKLGDTFTVKLAKKEMFCKVLQVG
ncbi:MAG: GreA/GreB family elongation factor [Patescibacteria group bacterium]